MTIQPPGPSDPPTIGRYRVLGTLDSAAGFRSVLATGPDDSLVVVRQALPELLDEPEFRIRMRHSAIAAMRVSGSANTTVIDVDADADTPWVASAFVPGVRLEAAVAEHGPLPVPAVRALAAALASALRTVHAAGLVHRRIRADTVLLARHSGRLGEVGITPAAGPATATAMGTPDFLSPEQSLGFELTAASDVFSLGSVLAFAASGVAPFAAPSVPYTLFNIAQREPDLSRVPEPLFEMLAACLRKDPAARPTPGQILDYLGAQPSGPPPWPAPVLDDIGRQQHEISALLAALPPITAPEPAPARPFPVIIAEYGRVGVESGRRAVEFVRRRWSAASPKARSGLAGGLAAVLVALVGVTYFATREQSEPGPVTGLTLAQLRQVDACPWLSSALGDSVPVAPTPLAADTWELSPSPSWGCTASSNRYAFYLHLGQEDEYLTPNKKVVEGVPVIDGSEASCTRAIASPGAEHESGVVIVLRNPSGVKECEGIDYIAANLARSLTTAPQAEGRESSLALLEPCALLDRDAVAEKIGALPPEPTIADAHKCQWDARVRVSLELVSTSTSTKGKDLEIVTVDGIQMYLDKGGSKAICTRAFLMPDAGEETIEVSVHGADGFRDEYCAIASSLLRQAVGNLPER
ncbi:protein kinase domain-containing protein [Nocardia fluminea]|uniref:Serine/threonine protein kinase n=1 Tax=Nocardia fluminea TaxID=134984 RepID=A0A2N3VA96_9NOCA|nr:protein kinase [Nocardia fluminea]PKV78554.1 serine/threonine protein kinase [Nocardia fluminea]